MRGLHEHPVSSGVGAQDWVSYIVGQPRTQREGMEARPRPRGVCVGGGGCRFETCAAHSRELAFTPLFVRRAVRFCWGRWDQPSPPQAPIFRGLFLFCHIYLFSWEFAVLVCAVGFRHDLCVRERFLAIPNNSCDAQHTQQARDRLDDVPSVNHGTLVREVQAAKAGSANGSRVEFERTSRGGSV